MKKTSWIQQLFALTLALAGFGCAAGLAPSTLVGRTDARALGEIVVIGHAVTCDVGCTKMACPGECCNRCSGALGLADQPSPDGRARCASSGHQGAPPTSLALADRACSGTECKLDCKPLLLGARYRVTGRLELPADAPKTGAAARPVLRASRIDLLEVPASLAPKAR